MDGYGIRQEGHEDAGKSASITREYILYEGGCVFKQSESDDHLTLQRNFSFVSMLGFGAVLICTWELVFA